MLDPNFIIDTFVKTYLQKDAKYILLSSWRVDLKEGVAYPMVGEDEDGRYILLFGDLSAARRYVTKYTPEKIAGCDPVGILPPEPIELAKYLLSLRKKGVKNVAISIGQEELAFTTVDDIVLDLPVDVTKKMESNHIWPVGIYGFQKP